MARHIVLAVCLLAAAFALASAECPPPLRGCGDACYMSDLYCCVAGILTQKWQCPQNHTDEPHPKPRPPPPTPPGPPGVKPAPADPSLPDLTIVNSCNFQLFIEARMGNDGGPLPGQKSTVTKLPAGQKLGFTVPAEGASGSRFWAKYGCDDNGRNCKIGDSQQFFPNPPGGCPPGGCQAPIDSLFEATWGCKPGAACNSKNPTTWWDTSQVDGWTLPYKVTLQGSYDQCDCDGMGRCPMLKEVDGSKLDLARCPKGEDVSWGGKYPTFGGHDMKNIDLRYIADGQVLGCMSPCKKLNFGQPAGLNINEGTLPTVYMCCPTPMIGANCQIDRGCIGPEDCRRGPIEGTKFVKAVHDMAPGVYAYSYDDALGLHACPAGTVKYTMEFCPAGSVQYPIPA